MLFFTALSAFFVNHNAFMFYHVSDDAKTLQNVSNKNMWSLKLAFLNKSCNFLNLRATSYLKHNFFFNFVNTNLHCFLNANCFMTGTSTTYFSMSEFASISMLLIWEYLQESLRTTIKMCHMIYFRVIDVFVFIGNLEKLYSFIKVTA